MLIPTPRRILLLALLAASTASCGRTPAAAIVPRSQAYSDGFEIVVFEVRDGAAANVRSLLLKKAEQSIADGAQAVIPGDPLAIQQQLSTGKSGDSRVVLTMKPLDGGQQQVRVAFHESSRTYVYEYVVDGNHLAPLGSEYRDLGSTKVVRYAAE